MSACELGELKNLLIIMEIRQTQPVRYSLEKGATLWDGGDRVDEKTRCFYVTLRHFNGEIIGRHVGLVCEVEKLRDEWGERRTFRLPAGARGASAVWTGGPGGGGGRAGGPGPTVCGRRPLEAADPPPRAGPKMSRSASSGAAWPWRSARF
jgi:hypothetical protein